MAGQTLHGALRSTCLSLDWVTFLSGNRGGLKQQGQEHRNTLDEALLSPEQAKQPSRPTAESILGAAEAETTAKFVEAKLAGRQGKHVGHRRPPRGPSDCSRRGSSTWQRWQEACGLLLLFALTALLCIHLGYRMGERSPKPVPSEARLRGPSSSEMGSVVLLNSRRRGPAGAPSPLPRSAAAETHVDEYYLSTFLGAPGPVALRRQEEALPGYNLDVYDVQAETNYSDALAHRRASHTPFFDGPASWLVGEAEEVDAPKASIRDELGHLLPLEQPLRVCLLTADFWGRKGAGGTATAYSLLAAALDEDPDLEVLLLAVTEDWQECESSRQQQSPRHLLVDYVCLQKRHFEPRIIKTHPYELLSHAVLSWAVEHQYDCDVMQVHEWGGVFQDLVAYSHLRQFRPGLRIAINTHGGHYWSTEGQLPRPSDIMSLRIDHGERTTLELSDIVLSPTRYIMSWLRQRGWRMPANREWLSVTPRRGKARLSCRLPLPNLINDIEEAPKERVDKKVWRLAFFSRLEERKGIKLFVDAVNRLPRSITSRPNFEVAFMGSEAKIDQLRSGLWLERKTAAWNFTVSVYMNLPREEALVKLKEDGFLLVQASMIDNMPYVLAEASVQGIPLIIYDVGGVTEMIDPKLHSDVLVGTPKGDGLAVRMRQILEAGHVQTTTLKPRVTNGKALWQAWHHDFAVNQQPAFEADDAMVRDEAALMEHDFDIVDVSSNTSSLQLYEDVCDSVGCSDVGCGQNASDVAPVVLLMPRKFEILDYSQMEKLVELINIARLRADDNIGALTFGAEIPEYKDSGRRLAYPTAPTWQLYEGEVEPWLMSDNCTDNVPVLLRRATFCATFNADARNFQQYSSFALSLMLAQSGLRLISFPEAAFRLTQWTISGYQCIMDKTPDRKLDTQVAANLMNDDELMLSTQLTPKIRPFVDFTADFSSEQGHRGWIFAHVDLTGQNASHQVADMGEMEEMQYFPDPSGQLPDGTWATPASKYPNMHRFILHPCAGWGRGQCASGDASAAVLRFKSYLAVRKVVFVLVYEVFPRCGDGVDFEVIFRPVDAYGETMVLHREEHGRMQKPLRQRLHFYIDQLESGDVVDLISLPKRNHDCDGVLILEAQLWDAREYHS